MRAVWASMRPDTAAQGECRLDGFLTSPHAPAQLAGTRPPPPAPDRADPYLDDSVPLAMALPADAGPDETAPLPRWTADGPAAADHPSAARIDNHIAHSPSTGSPATALSERAPAEGDLLRGRYRVSGVLGEGGMGTVFEVLDEYRQGLPLTTQRLALKVLRREATVRPDVVLSLLREFHLAQSLAHPNIVRVYEFDRDGDLAFFTMELLHGVHLNELLSMNPGEPLSPCHALAIVRDVGAALMHAHSRGVAHGDVKPDNIFITEKGAIRVLDFGSAHAVGGGRDALPGVRHRTPVATLRFASCEVLEGRAPNELDDLYSLACVAYMLLSGKHPYESRTALAARKLRLRAARPPGISWRQWRALRAGLSRERDRRPANLQAWLNRLDVTAALPTLPPLSVLTAAPVPRRRVSTRLAAVGATIAAIVCSTLWMGTGAGPVAAETVLTRIRAAMAPVAAQRILSGPIAVDSTKQQVIAARPEALQPPGAMPPQPIHGPTAPSS
jgi:serine/threonine protein kinase